MDPSKLKVQNTEGIKLVVKTLGGVWGQSKLETKYERFEKAIFGTVQKPDETHKSYLAPVTRCSMKSSSTWEPVWKR